LKFDLTGKMPLPRTPSALVGTLNLQGDVYNPFEFASDKSLAVSHKKLQDRALSLLWEDFAMTSGDILLELARRSGPLLDAMQVYCSSGEDRTVWSFFMHQEENLPALANDRKLLEPRLNCLSFAWRSYKKDGTGQWQMLDYWQDEMEALISRGSGDSPYKQDARLIVWDMACNVVCSLEAQAYRTMCTKSYLQPSKCAALARKFVWAARNRAGQQPLILGVQHWPRAGTAKEIALQKLLLPLDYGVCVGGLAVSPVALIYSRTQLGEPKQYGIDALGPTLMQQCLDEAIAQGEQLDLEGPLAQELLSTTATRVLLVRFPRAQTPLSRTRFLVMHASQPRDALSARLIARFALAVASHNEANCFSTVPNPTAPVPSPNADGATSLVATQPVGGRCPSPLGSDSNFDPVGRPLVVLADCSLGSVELAQDLRDELNSYAYESLPEPHVATTATHYSLLHLQCHDAAKCMTVAHAPSDKILAPRGTLKYPHVFPDLGHVLNGPGEGKGLGGEGGTLKRTELPIPAWPSDHALLTAVYTPVPVIKPVLAAPPAEKNKCAVM
jgi:hypothetical protein